MKNRWSLFPRLLAGKWMPVSLRAALTIGRVGQQPFLQTWVLRTQKIA